MKPIKEALYETVHRSKKPPKVLADETAISYNYLMRSALDGESGCDFNLKYLVPLMKASGNYEVLKTLATLTGHLLVKAPKGTRKGGKHDLEEYRAGFSKMMLSVIRHFQNPSDATYKEADKLMREYMSDTENLRRRCKNNLLHQKELF